MMDLNDIRNIVTGSGAKDWHVLSGDAPTYIGRLVERYTDGERSQEFVEHERRAVLRRDLDVGLAWGMDTHAHEDAPEPTWTEAFIPRKAFIHVVEVLYRGQPVDRELYAVVDEGHGVVPYTPALEVNHWQRDLVELLSGLGVSLSGSVEEYMGRCGITLVG